MSMTNTAAPYRRRGDRAGGMHVPVVMPLVDVAVDEQGYLSVCLDREPYSADGALTRGDLHRVLDEIATDLGTAIRVEVHEADDSTFTDIITPRTDLVTGAVAASPSVPFPDRVARHALASAFGISADGFTAGEMVEVCVVVAHQVADDDGTAQLRLPPALLDAHPQVVLLGRTSGVVALSNNHGEGVA